MVTCPSCEQDNRDGSRFCARCGSRLGACRVCGADLSPGANFCNACGAPTGAGAGPGLAAGLAQRGLASAVRDEILTDVAGEHRIVTALFADLAGSVARTRDLQPEEATILVNSLLEAMVDVLVRYGGRIDRFLGDGVLAVFGTPAIRENDAERAVRAALDILERADELELGVTVGINTGRVFFGPVGSDLHQEITVMGPVVNLAARLQSAAGTGEILLGPDTRDQVRAAFELTPRVLEIKGFDEPVTAYLAGRLLDDPDKVRGIEGLRSRLVGRDEELRHLAAAADAGGVAIGIAGDAGVGKSRLIAEFHRRGTRGDWLEGRCLELTRSTAYAPIRDLIRHRARAAGSIAAMTDALVAAGSLTEAKAAELAAWLTELMAPRPSERFAAVAAPQRKALIAAAVRDYLFAVARSTPAVVFIDDLQWCDDLSLDLLLGILPELAGTDLVLVVAYRPDPEGSAAGFALRAGAIPEARFAEVPLRPLRAAECSDMIRSMLDIAGLPPRFEEVIVERAAGNPFFVEELIRSFIQRGVVTRHNGHWSAAGDVEAVTVPASVEALVMSRLDRLTVPIRRSARTASVLGRTFTENLFARVAGAASTEHLEALAMAGFIYTERRTPEPEYAFVHDLTHQAIYESNLPSRRAGLHQQAGLVLEGLATAPATRVAYHFGRSPDDAKAVEWLLRAGVEAMDGFHNTTAVDLFTEGLGRAERLAESEREVWQSQYLARRGEVLERMARHDEARRDLNAALPLLGDDPLSEARVRRLVGQTYRLQLRFDEAHEWYDAAERTLDRSPERDTTPVHRMWIELQKERAFALYFGGRAAELPAHNERLAPVVAGHGSAAQQTDLLLSRSLAVFRGKSYVLDDDDVAVARAADDRANESGDPGRIAEARFMLGFALLWADLPAEAEPRLLEGVERARRIEDAMLETRARAYHAVALRRLGRVSDAAEAAAGALAIAERLEDDYYRGHAHANLAWVAWRRDDHAALVAEADRAVSAWTESEEDGFVGLGTEFAWLAVWPMAAASEAEGDLEEARRWLRYLAVPWERPMSAELAASVEQVLEGDGEPATAALRRAVELASAALLW